ncbi:MAG: hypothetical protein ACRC62_31950 [Microcoleus sp.]
MHNIVIWVRSRALLGTPVTKGFYCLQYLAGIGFLEYCKNETIAVLLLNMLCVAIDSKQRSES